MKKRAIAAVLALVTTACGSATVTSPRDETSDDVEAVDVHDDVVEAVDGRPDDVAALDAGTRLDVAAPLDATARPDAPPPRDVVMMSPDVVAPRDAGMPAVDVGRPPRPTLGQMLRRVVHARAYQNHRWTIDHESPESVGRALASLRPTYVSGLLRIASDEAVSAEQARDFDTIRRIVWASSPECQFDVVLNGQQYETPAALRRRLETVDDAVRPDAWFFDFFYDAYTSGYRNPLDQAVDWAHEHRQYIGGNTTQSDSVPRSDFAALSPVSHAGMVADGELDLKRDDIQRLHARGFAVLMHINNDPQFAPTTESCYFMGESGIARYDWGYDRRARWVGERARDQADWHFRFMYPVFFPECPIWHTYNAPRDRDMMSVFDDLARRYN